MTKIRSTEIAVLYYIASCFLISSANLFQSAFADSLQQFVDGSETASHLQHRPTY